MLIDVPVEFADRNLIPDTYTPFSWTALVQAADSRNWLIIGIVVPTEYPGKDVKAVSEGSPLWQAIMQAMSRPDCQETIQAAVDAKLDEVFGPDDPNAEHRLGARQLGIGRAA